MRLKSVSEVVHSEVCALASKRARDMRWHGRSAASEGQGCCPPAFKPTAHGGDTDAGDKTGVRVRRAGESGGEGEGGVDLEGKGEGLACGIRVRKPGQGTRVRSKLWRVR